MIKTNFGNNKSEIWANKKRILDCPNEHWSETKTNLVLRKTNIGGGAAVLLFLKKTSKQALFQLLAEWFMFSLVHLKLL